MSPPAHDGSALADAVVLAHDPNVQLVDLDGQIYGVGPNGIFGFEGVDVRGLRALLDLVDGRRTVAEIAAALPSYPPAEVRELLAQLEGIVLRRAPRELASSERARRRIAVVGSGHLAAAIASELRRRGFANPTSLESAQGTAGHDLVVCALENVQGQAILSVNAACLEAKIPALFVAVEGETSVIGPLVAPGLSPCFACSRLSTSLASHADIGPRLLPLLRFGAVDEERDRPWLARIAMEACAEIERALLGTGYPARAHSILSVAPGGDPRITPVEAVTACSACHGHHRGERLGASSPLPPVVAAFARDHDPRVCDDTGGTRSVPPDEAVKRARAAFTALGVDVACEPLGVDAPDPLAAFGCPFYATRSSASFDRSAPMMWKRLGEPCYGKGTSDLQAQCSASFEWLERNLSQWRGDHDLVRASYREVATNAIDVAFLASGRLPGFTLPNRQPFDPDVPIDWVWGHCLRRQRPILVPAASVFLDDTRFFGSDLELPRAGSSGLSAGCSVADAVLQGLLEIVERDATFTALRNGLERPAIELDDVREPAARALLDRIVAAGYTPLIRDTTSAIAVPTVEVYLVGDGQYGNHFAMGYGAHLNRDVAMRRAVTEAAQSLFGASAFGVAQPLTADTSWFEVFPHRMQALGKRSDAKRDAAPASAPPASLWEQIDLVVQRIAAAIPQADVCAVDLSLPSLAGVHVVRTLVTGAFDEARPVQVHVPERCRLLPLDEMYLGRIAI